MSPALDVLGRTRDERMVIVSADGLGALHATNTAIYDALRTGFSTSASLMVPAAWSRHAAREHRGEPIGVALTLLNDHAVLRWTPITQAPSLLGGDGGFAATPEDLWDHADLDEARRECRSQLERAVLWGFDVTHLTAHREALWQRPEFFDVYLELAVDYDLPLRLPGIGAEPDVGFPFRSLAAERGIMSPDHVVVMQPPDRGALEVVLSELEPGLSEIVLSPAIDTPELRAVDDDWASRVRAHDLLVHDRAARAMLERSGVHLVSYADLCRAQREV